MTFILSPPTVSAADWQILHNSISFLFEGEGSDNGYVITLYEGDTAVEKISLESHKQTIEFSNLQVEKTIPSLWKMITEWV